MTLIFLSSLPTYKTLFWENKDKANICKISMYSKKWQEGKVQRREDRKGWEETTCGCLRWFWVFFKMERKLKKWKKLGHMSGGLGLQSFLFTTFSYKNTHESGDCLPKPFHNKCVRKSHLCHSLCLNSSFRVLWTHTLTQAYKHTDALSNTNACMRAGTHMNPLQVTSTISLSYTNTHTQTYTSPNTISCFRDLRIVLLSFQLFLSITVTISVPKHNGWQQLVAWLTLSQTIWPCTF